MRDAAQQMLLSAALRRMENRLIKLEGSVELTISKLEELLSRPPFVTLMIADDSHSETTQVAEESADETEYRMIGEQGN
jgi:hypothetical protein